VRDGQRETVAQKDLQPGDVIEVSRWGASACRRQADDSFASFDESALTGESIPVERNAGESVPAGATSADRLVQPA
jgi:Cd2+/Zn2+-exporting ATPase